MKKRTNVTTGKAQIQCLEVLISKTSKESMGNLQWTLSVYSLQNQPVRKNCAIPDGEIFHFMVFDWKRTIKQLLDTHQVSYSVIQYFDTELLFSDSLKSTNDVTREIEYLAAAHQAHNEERVAPSKETEDTAAQFALEENVH